MLFLRPKQLRRLNCSEYARHGVKTAQLPEDTGYKNESEVKRDGIKRGIRRGIICTGGNKVE